MLPSHITPTIVLLLTLHTVTAWPSLSDLSPWLPWVRHSTKIQTNELEKRANQTVWISSDVYHGETFFEYASMYSVPLRLTAAHSAFDFWNYSDPTQCVMLALYPYPLILTLIPAETSSSLIGFYK